eukprot:gene8484-10428_t
MLLVYDSVNNRQYYDYYGGLDITLNLWNQNETYYITPQVYQLGCMLEYGSGSLQPIFPTDTSNWVFNGTATVNDVQVYTFSQTVVKYGKPNYYTVSIDQLDGSLVQYYINGENTVIVTSHPDIYILDVSYFSTDISNYEYVFTVPSFLQCDASEDSWSGTPDDDGDKAEEQKEKEPCHDPHHIVNHAKKNEDKYKNHFQSFKETHDKRYQNHKEHNHRYNTFKNRLHYIMKHNNKKESTFTMGMNHFGDYTDDELNRLVPKKKSHRHDGMSLTNDGDEDYPGAGFHIPMASIQDLPESVDWREKGCVTSIKDQGICGSCWAHGAIAALESQNCIVNGGDLVELSEQQLVDCAYQQGSQGCFGGSAYGAFQYVIENSGISTEQGYQYNAVQQYCKINQRSSTIKVSGYNRVLNGSESDLQEVIATIGPVAAAIDTHLGIEPDFYFYQSGVYSSPLCNSWDYDHEISIIGYGTLNGQD